ncbi:MAG TPA: hypothetical protein VM689_25050 [Aliidongia sp.]|nr:hypothetical protein [Aliidongia sp.]
MMLMSTAVDPAGIGGVILRSMAPLPLFAAGLALGVPAAIIAAIVGIGACWALDPHLGIAFSLGTALPVVLLVPLALRPPAPRGGWLVSALTALGVVCFLLLDLSFRGETGGLEAMLTQTVAEGFRQIAEQVPELDASQLGEPQRLAFWLPGSGIVGWLLIVALDGVLAQGALARFQRSLVTAPDMAMLSVPRVTSIGFVAAVIAAWAGKGEIAFMGANLAVILAFPLLFGGLGVIHALVARHPARQMVLTLFYVVVLGLVLPIVMVVALGVVEQWAGLRQRLAAQPRRGDE